MANFTNFNKHSHIVYQVKRNKNDESISNQFKIMNNKLEHKRKIKAQRQVLKKILQQEK